MSIAIPSVRRWATALTLISSLGLALQFSPAAAQLAASAAEQASAEEQRARQLVDKFIEQTAGLLNGLVEARVLSNVTIGRDYQLDMAAGRYEAVIDKFALEQYAFSLNLAPLALVLEPRSDGSTAISLRLPDAIAISQAGETLAQLTLGSQRANAVFSETLGMLTEQSFSFRDLRLSFTKPDSPAVTMAAIDLQSKLEVAADQTWQHPVAITFKDLAVADAAGTLKIDNGAAEGIAGGSDFSRSRESLAAFTGMFDSELSEQAVVDLVTALFDTDTGYVSNLLLNEMSFRGAGGEIMGRLARMGIGSDLGINDDQGKFSYRFELSGIEIPMLTMFVPMMPEEIRVGVSIDEIGRQLYTDFIKLSMAAENVGDAQLMALVQARLPALLLANPLRLDIDESYIKTADAAVHLDGSVRTSHEAMLGALGDLSLVIRGLPDIVAATGIDADPGAAQMLQMFTGMSERSDTDGVVTDTLALALTAEGKLTLNGQDISAMLGMGAAFQ